MGILDITLLLIVTITVVVGVGFFMKEAMSDDE